VELLPNRRCRDDNEDEDDESNATVAMVVVVVVASVRRLVLVLVLLQDTSIIADGRMVPPPPLAPPLHRVKVKTIRTVAAVTVIIRYHHLVVVVWAATRGSSTRLVGCGCGSSILALLLRRLIFLSLVYVQYLSLSLWATPVGCVKPCQFSPSGRICLPGSSERAGVKKKTCVHNNSILIEAKGNALCPMDAVFSNDIYSRLSRIRVCFDTVKQTSKQ
jgi:hypothetical protein